MTSQGHVDECYYIYEGGACWADKVIDEDSNLFDDDGVTCTEVKVNEKHYYKGYFFYNDMDDYEDKDEHYPSCFNSMEDLDTYIDSNNSGGHFQCTYIEEWVDGELVKVTQVSDADGDLVG